MQQSNSGESSRSSSQKIGEQLLEGGLINEEQIEQTLKRQSQTGGNFGSLLIEMGFIAINELLDYLSNKFSVPAENLFHRTIEAQTLQLIPFEKMETHRILPLSIEDGVLVLAMVNPQDLSTLKEIEFQVGRKVRPVVVPAFMLTAALKQLKSGVKGALSGDALADLVTLERGEDSPNLASMLRYFIKSGASDMLLCSDAPPSVKIGNVLKRLALPALSPADCENYLRELLPAKAWDTFIQKNDIGMGATYRGIGRFRVTAFRQRQSVAIALRAVYEDIPSLSTLNLPDWLAEYAMRPHGLIIISGPAGHGKSTTLAAMVDVINTQRGCNIITLEDPIEYLHKHKRSNILQREVGRDTPTFFEGMRHIFRQAPDVIVVGELRDKETFRIALQAANSGHLVLSTAHAENATAIIESTVTAFEPHEQNQIRTMLSDSLILSVFQCLVPKKADSGRLPAVEKFINTRRLKKFVREGKTHQIRSQLQSGAEDFVSIDIALAELCNQDLVEFDAGLAYAEDQKYYRDLVKKAAH